MTARDRGRIESGWQRTTVSLAIVTGVALVVGGCSPTDERSAMPELSLTEAKTETQELEMRIVDAFPQGVVASADQRQAGCLHPIGPTFARLSHHDGCPINDPVEKQRFVRAGLARGWARTARDSAGLAE